MKMHVRENFKLHKMYLRKKAGHLCHYMSTKDIAAVQKNVESTVITYEGNTDITAWNV